MCVTVFPAPAVQGPANRADGQAHSMYHFAPTVIFNFPPNVRLSKYIDSNYDYIQKGVVDFSSQLLYLVGFSSVESDVPILTQLRTRRFVSIFLGLLINVIVFVLFALCSILIYSLMSVNVQVCYVCCHST